MENETYIQIRDTGKMELVSIQRTPTVFPEAVLSKFAGKIGVKVAPLLDMQTMMPKTGFGNVGMMMSPSGDSVDFLVRVHELRFRCPILVLEGGYVSPDFNVAASDPRAREAVDFMWNPGYCNYMTLFFACSMARDPSIGTCTVHAKKCYLFAADQNNAIYRLPTSNVYDEGTVCMGNFDANCTNPLHGLRKALEQLWSSNWNSDLVRNAATSGPRLFRFSPNTEGEGFIVQPPNYDDWRSLCTKIGSTYLSSLLGGIRV